MQVIKFGNKRVLQINDFHIKNEITKLLENYNIISSDKNYKFLDKRSLDYLKINKHYITLSSFGKKYILFMTIINNKKYCFFINKKNNIIVSIRYRFKDAIFLNTIIDGELLKDNNNQWIFSIIDIFVYKGDCQSKYPLTNRLETLNNLINDEYKKDINFDVAKLEVKQYFDYRYINDLYNRYKEKLSYRCSGFIFKNMIINEKYLLYIFQENRTKHMISSDKINKNNDKDVLISFIVRKTELPDIYELYCSKNDALFKYGIALINTLSCSKFIKDLFNNKKEENVYVSCSYNTDFKKWVPYSENSTVSDYNKIKEME